LKVGEYSDVSEDMTEEFFTIEVRQSYSIYPAFPVLPNWKFTCSLHNINHV